MLTKPRAWSWIKCTRALLLGCWPLGSMWALAISSAQGLTELPTVRGSLSPLVSALLPAPDHVFAWDGQQSALTPAHRLARLHVSTPPALPRGTPPVGSWQHRAVPKWGAAPRELEA